MSVVVTSSACNPLEQPWPPPESPPDRTVSPPDKGPATPLSAPVVEPTVPPPPISGGTMTVLSDGTLAIADPDRDAVYLVAPDHQVSAVSLNLGDEPGRVVEGPQGSIFVALRRGTEVAAIDTTTRAVSHFTACAAPRGLAWSAADQALWVACASGALARLDFSASPPALTTLHPAPDLRDVVLVDGHPVVTTFRTAEVFSVAADGTPTPWMGPLAQTVPGRTFAPQVAWRTVASKSGLLMVYQEEQTSPLTPSSSGAPSYGASDTSNLGVVAPQTAFLYGSSMRFLPDLPQLALPVDVAVAPDESAVAVAFAGTNLVMVDDGLGSPNDRGFYSLMMVGTPTSVAFSRGQLAVFVREPAVLELVDLGSGAAQLVPLSNRSVESTAHHLFHASTPEGIACASCHPEGGEDGHVWTFPEGRRRTPTLRGGLSGTEPFHWSGEEPDIQSLVDDVLVQRMGGDAQDAPHTQALLRWLDTLPKRPAPLELDPDAEARGGALFAQLGCAQCHAGALGTNNATVDVGTGDLFQVPRLAELAYRAPFLHDGSVPTLADRFTPLGGRLHGDTQGLTPSQIADLVAYLQGR